MAGPARSPRVLGLSWGRMEVETLGAGRDFVLYPGGGRPWDWTQTGTHHDPGIQPADVMDLLTNGATVVVLSRGMERRLGVCPETLDLLRESGVEVHVEETRRAVGLYNEWCGSRAVGGLFHSTC
jgi:hypothetical protein